VTRKKRRKKTRRKKWDLEVESRNLLPTHYVFSS
jgi:hypothetical protein